MAGTWSKSSRKRTTRTKNNRRSVPEWSSFRSGSSTHSQMASNEKGQHEERQRGALDGVRVIDLSRVLAGPLCTQMLADHGADVIKIEPPTGDDTRRLGPPFDEHGDAAYFSSVNRGKRSVCLDLTQPADRAVLLSLLKDADVLVENFLPGTMKRWGLDEASLAPIFPRLIYCSITGFGADGPLGGLPGYDAVLQAICGLMSINGSAESGPTRIGVPVV
ncbi:MAG: CoA transferase, partial [Burkholderiaceae bacterium]|nr:CoA transferase [Burkholderiaceae bacterium]